MGADPTEKQAQAAQAKFDACVVGCAKEQQSQVGRTTSRPIPFPPVFATFFFLLFACA